MNTNSFGTSPIDRLTLVDRITQVTADTGSTVPVSESEVKQLWISCLIVITLATHFQLYIIHVLVAPYEHV